MTNSFFDKKYFIAFAAFVATFFVHGLQFFKKQSAFVNALVVGIAVYFVAGFFGFKEGATDCSGDNLKAYQDYGNPRPANQLMNYCPVTQDMAKKYCSDNCPDKDVWCPELLRGWINGKKTCRPGTTAHGFSCPAPSNAACDNFP